MDIKRFDRVRPTCGRYSGNACVVISTEGVLGLEFGVVPDTPHLCIPPVEVAWYSRDDIAKMSDGIREKRFKVGDRVRCINGYMDTRGPHTGWTGTVREGNGSYYPIVTWDGYGIRTTDHDICNADHLELIDPIKDLTERVEKLEKALAENSAENSAEPYVPQFLDKVRMKDGKVGYVTQFDSYEKSCYVRTEMNDGFWIFAKDFTLISRKEG